MVSQTAQMEQGGLGLEPGPAQGRESTTGAPAAILSALQTLHRPGSGIPAVHSPLGKAACPAEVGKADVLNTRQQVPALIPLKPAAKAPI